MVDNQTPHGEPDKTRTGETAENIETDQQTGETPLFSRGVSGCVCPPTGTRTQTGSILSRLPLPIGLWGVVGNHSILTRIFPLCGLLAVQQSCSNAG